MDESELTALCTKITKSHHFKSETATRAKPKLRYEWENTEALSVTQRGHLKHIYCSILRRVPPEARATGDLLTVATCLTDSSSSHNLHAEWSCLLTVSFLENQLLCQRTISYSLVSPRVYSTGPCRWWTFSKTRSENAKAGVTAQRGFSTAATLACVSLVTIRRQKNDNRSKPLW